MISVRRTARLGVPVFFLALALGSVQCGLLASPGEYTSGSGDDTSDGGGGSEGGPNGEDGSTSKDGSVVLPDGFVIPASIGTIALLAGQRDPTSADDNPAWSADAWSGVLAADGTVATWQIEKSAPIVGAFDTAGLIGTTWVMLNNGFGIAGTRAAAIQSTSWAPGIVGDWKALRENGAPGGLDETTHAFNGAHLFYIGGTRTNPGVDGGPPNTFFVNEAQLSNVDKAVPDIGPSAPTGAQLINARSRAAVTFSNGVMYVIGGRSPAGMTASVEIAKVDAVSGAIQAFAETAPLMTNAMPWRIFAPEAVVANGYLFVAGGRVNTANVPTDVVLSAKINPDGTLGMFRTVTALQRPLHDFAFVAVKDRLYVAGGVTTSVRTDEVWSAAILADGTLGQWQSLLKLPSPRSDLVALTY